MKSQLLAALFLFSPLTLLSGADKPPVVGSFKDWNDLDRVEIRKVFKLSDYARVALEPLDTKSIELPPKEDNTYEPVLEAQSKFNERFLLEVQKRMNPMPVESAAKSTDRASEGSRETPGGPRMLRIKGQLTKMNPGSRAARYWGGFGAGHARVEIICTLTDASTGEILGAMTHARTSSGGVFGGSYEKLLKKLTEEVGEDLSRFLLSFK